MKFRAFIHHRRSWLLAGAIVLAVGVWLRCGPLPDHLFGARAVQAGASTTVVDRHGEVLFEARSSSGTRGEDLGPDQIPSLIESATLAAEDARFYSHPGIDPLATARAMWRNVRAGRVVEGGSTISQQVAKLLIARAEGPSAVQRGWRAKAREAVIALRLEHRFMKREILAMYLNLAPYGNQIRGVERASQAYFGRPASTVTAAEAAYLAALPQQPSRFNPWNDASTRTGRAQASSAGPEVPSAAGPQLASPAGPQSRPAARAEPASAAAGNSSAGPEVSSAGPHVPSPAGPQVPSRAAPAVRSPGPGEADGAATRRPSTASAGPQVPLTRLEKRRQHILDRMRVLDRISAEEYRIARAERVRLQRETREALAPHFVERVLSALDPSAIPPERVVTTLDATLQRHIRGIIDSRREELRRHHQAHNIAVAVLDNRTGEWLAWEGSGNYFDADHGGAIDGVVAPRQPGSALKPFAYAAAFERDYHPARVLADVPSQFPTAEPGILYAPRNYDDQFRGPMLARAALAGSENVPAVALVHDIGVPAVMRMLRDAGFSTLDANAAHYGLGITLGNAEVRLADLVAGYAMFARGGITVTPALVLRSEDRSRAVVQSGYRVGDVLPSEVQGAAARRSGDPGDGRLASEGVVPVPVRTDTAESGALTTSVPPSDQNRLISQRTAFWIADILSDDEARAFIFGRGGSLEFPFTVAAKTGTSQAYHDNWAIGFTREVTVGVWVGNFDRKPLVGSSGVTGAGPIFHDVMLAAVERVRGALPIGDRSPIVAPTSDVQPRAVCAVSGLTPGAACDRRVTEWLPADAHLGDCTWHRHGSAGEIVTLWPDEYRPWARSSSLPTLSLAPSSTRATRSDGPTGAGRPGERTFDDPDPRPNGPGPRTGDDGPGQTGELEIVSPLAGATFLRDPTLRSEFQTLPLRARGARGPVEWRVNGITAGTSSANGSDAVRWALAPGQHRIEVRDSAGRTTAVTITVR